MTQRRAWERSTGTGSKISWHSSTMNSVFSIILFWLLFGFTGKYVKSQIAHPPYVSIPIEQQVLLGETAEIRCNLYSNEHVNLYLEKDGQIVDAPNNLEPITFNIFKITNVSLENGGMYNCYLYNLKTSWSYRSESVALKIIDPHLSKPSIFVSPSQYVCSESNTTIHCCIKGSGSRKRFYLQTEFGSETLQWMETNGDRASFTISKDPMFPFFERSYRCSYSPVSALYRTSKLSDNMKLIFKDNLKSPYPFSDPIFCEKRPNISLDHTKGVALGGNITIYCQKLPHDPNMAYYLQRPGNPTSHVVMQTAKGRGKFFISNASWEHKGRYTCTYQNFSFISEASEPVELTIIDSDLPKPNIAVIPRRRALRYTKVIILCWTKFPAKMFYLHCAHFGCKKQSVKPDGNVAKFPMARYTEGSYCCSYSTQPGNFTSSAISDDVELLHISENRTPTLSLSPKKEVIIGGNVTIHCKHSEPSHTFFYLQKPGEQLVDELMETEGHKGKFLISNVSKEHGGRYSCTDSYQKDTFSISGPSNSVELVIIDPDLPRPNISIIPNQMAFLGSNIIIQCTTKGSSKRFYLHKDGGQMEPQLMEPDGETATFSVLNISQSHGGKYKCSYRRPSWSSISSVTSEAMDLLVEDPSETMDQINTIRFVIGGVIMLLLTYIVTSDYLFWKKQECKVDLKHNVPRGVETLG